MVPLRRLSERIRGVRTEEISESRVASAKSNRRDDVKITDARKDGQIPVGRIYHARCFEFDGHFYMRVRTESTYAKIHVPSLHVAAINLRSGGIRALHVNTHVRAIVTVVTVSAPGETGSDFGEIILTEPSHDQADEQ